MRKCNTAAGTDFLASDDPTAGCETKVVIQVPVGDAFTEGKGQTSRFGLALATEGGTVKTALWQGYFVRALRRDIVARHQMTYLKEFNSKPYEGQVHDSNCNSDFNPNMASCGLAIDGNGTFIPMSQGFCCDCTECYDGSCDKASRSNTCNIRTTKAAACLRETSLYYSGYTIEPEPALSWRLDVQVWGNISDYITPDLFTIRPVNTSVTLSPDVPKLYNASDGLLVMYNGSKLDTSLRGPR